MTIESIVVFILLVSFFTFSIIDIYYFIKDIYYEKTDN